MSLDAQLETAMRAALHGEPFDFDAWAARLFAHHWEHVEPYRRYCERLGVRPAAVGAWQRRVAKPLLTALIALVAACTSGTNEDAVENADLNQPAAEDLDQAAMDAANDAANAEAEALSDQMNQLNSTAPAAENTMTASDAQEQNVAGM